MKNKIDDETTNCNGNKGREDGFHFIRSGARHSGRDLQQEVEIVGVEPKIKV